MTVETRAATAADAPRLQEIERQAGEQFRSVGMSDVADADPFSVEEITAYTDDGRCWVAVLDGATVGYLVIDRHETAGHIEQVSVVPEAQGRGIGRTLVGEAEAWTRAQRLSGMTLTTFRDVAWNEPLYARLGFRTLAEPEWTPDLIAVRERETAHGLDPARRVCMSLELGPAPTT